ncbi:SAR2788 family putative toxin [Bacillus pumilus]|uniref:SAR2788 family putative toxin n=1 Tax=Bacillus TaxID=1386 RepID=UPI000AEFC14A|nr:SAR2788 family putative toxin [Bacillus pumilus]MBR0588958.1 hypothetical protein [Bacillus pumilus sxm20-2]MCI4617719.1 SAR2788 family putative toxin [Bacillus pumilus]
MFSKILSFVLVFTIVFTTIAPSFASAKNSESTVEEINVIDTSLLEQLEDKEIIELEENLAITEYFNDEVSHISTKIDEEDLQADTVLSTDLESGEMFFEGQIADNNELIDANFQVYLDYMDGEDFGGYLVDLNTNEKYEFDTRLADASAVPLVIIAVQIVRFGVQWAIKKYGKKVVTNALNSSARLATKNVKKSLLNDTGVKISLFTKKVKGKQEWKDPKSGWSISRDLGKGNSHGGSYYKLMNKSGERIATLNKSGHILRK